MGRAAHFVVGTGRAEPGVQAGANTYRMSQGMAPEPDRDYSHVRVDPVVSRHIASLYAHAPSVDPAAIPSYHAMREDTMRQFDHLTRPQSRGGMGFNVQVTPHDPYEDAVTPEDPHGNYKAMVNDVQNQRLKVFSTASSGGHPQFDDDTNDAFRAVHDTFGHAGTGRNFDRNGEEAAWRKHVSMYSQKARPAMTSETRGQSSTLVFGPRPGMFPEQKVVNLGPTAQVIGRRSLGHVLGRQFLQPSTGLT